MKIRVRDLIVPASLAAAIVATAVISHGAEFDPNEAFKTILTWDAPDNYPPPLLHGMDVRTLSVMLDSGNLQWYESRPVKDTWNGVVGLKIHAPPEAVWKVITDYELQCEIMKDSLDTCETFYRKDNEVRNKYKAHTSVIRFSYKFDLLDVVKEEPPYNLHIDTVLGGLQGRQIDIRLVPVDDGKECLLFMRYYPALRSLGSEMRVALRILPVAEGPVAVSVANYHSRAYKNEAERRVGYKPAEKPGNLDITSLDLKTLRQIYKMNGGLMRETPQGKAIDALTYSFIDAPPDLVWKVATDFENFDNIFVGSHNKVESVHGNTVIMRQRVNAVNVLVFKLELELHSRYTLYPPNHIVFTSIDGVYKGTNGDLRFMLLENGRKTLLYATSGVNLDDDRSLVASVAKSGAFPMNNIVNLLSAQATLGFIRKEAERRAKQ